MKQQTSEFYTDCADCGNNPCNYGQESKEIEKEYLDALVENHWNYIAGLLWAASQSITDEDRIAEIEYHYKTAFKHGWGHAREFHVGETI